MLSTSDTRRAASSVTVVVWIAVLSAGFNSAALRKWNITRETPQQPGGRITRDAKGELNGELIDRAKALVQLPPSAPLTIEALVEQHKKLNAAGLTSIRYPGASIEQYRLLEEMKRRGLLTVRVSQLMRVPAGSQLVISVRTQNPRPNPVPKRFSFPK